MQRVLVSGASGPIGAALLPSLQSQGWQVLRLVRRPAQNPNEISWEPLLSVNPQLVSGFDAVVHLSGESVMGRWTESKKKSIRNSRLLSTRNLCNSLTRTSKPPHVFICASAVGYYGDRGVELLTEVSAAGDGFLASLTQEWEAETRIAADAGIRAVNLRIGLVLSREGGALPKMLLPFKLGLGGKLGSGRQWWSWIHVADIADAIRHVIETEALSGPVNIVAPGPVTNAEFTHALAAVLRRPAVLPVPAFVANIALGEMARELVLSSQRVKPEKLEAAGYAFQFPDLSGALNDLLG